MKSTSAIDSHNYVKQCIKKMYDHRNVSHGELMLLKFSNLKIFQVQIKRLKLPYITNCSTGWENTWYEDWVNGTFAYSSEVN
jgi:hypothetical protein